MNHRTKPKRLFGFGRATPRATAPDAADLGTAFGMEVTLDQPPLPLGGLATGADTPPGWIRRLATRRPRKN